MSNSGEDPLWFQIFKAPTAADDEPSSEERNDDNDKVHDQSGEESTFDENSRGNSSKRRLSLDQNGTPQKKKKVDIGSNSGGDDDHELVADQVESEEQNAYSVRDHIFDISSGSDASLDDNPAREQKSPQPSDHGNLNDVILINESQDSPAKNSLKKKSPKKNAKKENQRSPQSSDCGNLNDAILKNETQESPLKKALEKKASKKNANKEKSVNINEEREGIDDEVKTSEGGLIKPSVSASRVPLVLSDKVNRSKVLVECEGDSIDLSGDMGAVGRIIIQDTPSGNNEMCLDLKGTIYKTTVVPSRTFCVVSFGPTEAKVESIMNDFIQLNPLSNANEDETMVEGTLDGFSFDSEDEGEKRPKPLTQEPDQNQGIEEQAKGKNKGKKRGKTSGSKPHPPKKVKKRAASAKKTKTKK